MTKGWTEGKPWEIAWGELRGEGRDGSDGRVEGEETMGNSMGRATLGGNGWKQQLGGRRGNRRK